MANGFEKVVNDSNAIKAILRSRKKDYIEKTVLASNLELARKKSDLEKIDGWSVLRENKASIRMKKEKPIDEQLEDNVWCILAQMGFHEMSKDRHFKIKVGDNVPPRQIDVFAKDNETAIFIECTICEERRIKDLSTLIEKIQSIRKEIFDRALEHYGRNEPLKMRWGIATQNIEWRNVDEKKCEEANIFILRELNLTYYKKLVAHLRSAARYQLLASVFRSEKVKGLDLCVPATKGKVGHTVFYNFLMKPHDLLKIAYISHNKGDDIDDFETYQRMPTSRLKKIGAYIDKGGQFPTNIVVNIHSKKGLEFDKKEKIGTSSYGQLHLPSEYGSAWIIDGQHRLYGYLYSERSEKGTDDKTVFPVLAYANLPSEDEADMFITINCTQVKVSRNLLNEIYAGLKWNSDDFKERIEGLCARVVILLNKLSTSPIFEKIITTNTKKTNYRCLTLNSMVDGLKENAFFGEEKKSGVTPGPLTASYYKELKGTLEKAIAIIEKYFSLFKAALEDHWMLGDAPGGFLCTNNGLRALLRVLKEIFDHIQYEKGTEIHSAQPEELYEDIAKYTQPLIDFFKTLSPDDFQIFRNRTALKGVDQNSLQMLVPIHEKYREFHPKKLKKYLETIDVDGTREAQKLIDEIQHTMFIFVLSKLKLEFPEKWWYDGIPETVRLQCVERREKDKGAKEPEQYLIILDYHTIAEKKWNLFQKYFSMTHDGGKKKKLEWVRKLGMIRNITHHREKWPAEKEQVKFVRKVHKHVMEKFR